MQAATVINTTHNFECTDICGSASGEASTNAVLLHTHTHTHHEICDSILFHCLLYFLSMSHFIIVVIE